MNESASNIYLTHWKEDHTPVNTTLNYIDVHSNEPIVYQKDAMIHLIFCDVMDKRENEMASIEIKSGLGEMLLDPASNKIRMIKLYRENILHDFSPQNKAQKYPLYVSCLYEEYMDNLMIYLMHPTAFNLLSTLFANENYFGRDIMLDVDRDGKLFGIEIMNASQYLTNKT